MSIKKRPFPIGYFDVGGGFSSGVDGVRGGEITLSAVIRFGISHSVQFVKML